jgi:hypothetical protein
MDEGKGILFRLLAAGPVDISSCKRLENSKELLLLHFMCPLPFGAQFFGHWAGKGRDTLIQ